MSITPEQIKASLRQVIEQRQPLVRRIEKVETNLSNIQSLIKNLEEERSNLSQELMISSDNSEVAQKLNNLKFLPLLKRTDFQLKKLALIRERFDRGTINIGTVGRMRQGKSTLLQKISGLSPDVIPSRKGGACTAVRSTIYHHQGTTKAKVTFHTEQSFLKEVIGSYYQELELGSTPSSIDNFATNSLPSQPSEITKKAMYERLKNEYYAHIQQYRHLLQPNQPLIKDDIPEAQIRDYVAHPDEDNNTSVFFNHLAVKHVEIYCSFSKSEVEQIALVDIPGLGDLRVGDEKLMLETLGKEVDIVLFVRRPDGIGDAWKPSDTQLYSTAEKALSDLPERAFMVINHVRENGDNYKDCQRFKNNIHTTHMKVVKPLFIADCQDTDEANKVLERILKYLAENIQQLDRKYAQSRQDHVNFLHKDIKTEVEAASLALVELANSKSQFKKRFKELYNNLANGLEKLRQQLKQQSKSVDSYFENEINTVLQVCQQNPGIPNLEEITKERNAKSGSYREVYLSYVTQMRAHLSQHFLSLNQGLKQSLQELKTDVAKVFIDEGNLRGLINTSQSNDLEGTKFLEQMIVLFDQIENQLDFIKSGFTMIEKAQISYEGLVLADIREQFDNLLDPDTVEVPKIISVEVDRDLLEEQNDSTNKNTNFQDNEANNNSKAVRNALEKLYEQVIKECTSILDKYKTEPSRVKYRIMTEFMDRILRANGVKDQWEIFLEDESVRTKVWPEFQKEEEYKQRKREWDDLVKKIKEVNEPQKMQFLIYSHSK